MVSKAMAAKLNQQAKNEWESEFFYLTMMAWCFNNNYNGFGAWFLKQAAEEREHGMKIFRYLNETDQDIVIPSITVPKADFKSVEDVFEQGLAHEQEVSRLIGKLADQAISEKDHATLEFLQWYIKEQVEEESSFRDIVTKLGRIKGSVGGLFMLEAKLAERA
jgi:ferritin